MYSNSRSAAAIAQELGERLKQARLNVDMTQVEVARHAGVSRKSVLNAEKGKASLEVFVAIMSTLGLTGQLDNFLPAQEISPIQLAKLRGRKRQRASGLHATAEQASSDQDSSEW